MLHLSVSTFKRPYYSGRIDLDKITLTRTYIPVVKWLNESNISLIYKGNVSNKTGPYGQVVLIYMIK